MSRSPLCAEGYTPQFSGHETFPLRYGWLRKVYDRVAETQHETNNRVACWDDDAIARFGVGKNMVRSMRHWAKAAGIIDEAPNGATHTTLLGDLLFGKHGFDPYLEYPTSLWLIHWQLAAISTKTTWFWAFNHCPAITFDRDHLVKGIQKIVEERAWQRASETTVKSDVACFLHTYVARRPSGTTGYDDALESPLTELGLIKATGKKDGFRFARGPKSTLGNGVFAYAVADFWSRYSGASTTLSFEAVAQAPGSPGRVFVFDENDIAVRLARLEEATDGALSWSESAGLKQVVRTINLNGDTKFQWLAMDFGARGLREVA